MFRAVAALAQRLGADRSGLVAVAVAVILPAAISMVGAGVDFALIARSKQQFQRAADSAALAGAGSLQVANTSTSRAALVAEEQGRSSVNNYSEVTVRASATSKDVQVTVTADIPMTFLRLVGSRSVHVEARARAQLLGSTPTCLLVVDPSLSKAYEMDKATLSAAGCAVFANSTAQDAISLRNKAEMTASSICSSGGATSQNATYTPSPTTDCPSRNDPLVSRTLPTVGSCTSSTKLVLESSTTLIPGTYCGGIEIRKNATVILQAGTYVIKEGPLRLDGSSSLQGSGVTIFMTGTGAELSIDGDAAMSLTAPAYGDMAGMLIVGDRTLPTSSSSAKSAGPAAGPTAPAASPPAQLPKHRLHSRSAPTLLGTVYLPQGSLEIGAPGGYDANSAGMAQNSAWTIIVVRQLSIHDKINLVLNTNYAATDVPPPSSLVRGTTIQLAN